MALSVLRQVVGLLRRRSAVAQFLSVRQHRAFMRLVTTIQRVQREKPRLGWFLTGLGFISSVISVVGVFLLFGSSHFASDVRDQVEKPPGAVEYSLFALAMLAMVSLFVAGLILIWARVRKYVAA